MPVVGELVVNLKAQTASFTDSMGKTRQCFVDFKEDAAGAGQAMDFSMREARGSLMVMEHELGVHLPREINTLIASVPGVGAAFQTLLPIMGVVFAAGLIYKFVEDNKKAAAQVAEAWTKNADTTNSVFASLGDKLLEVGIKADHLAKNDVGALLKQLQLIDRQTFAGIISETVKLGKSAEDAFSKMAETNWFMRWMQNKADAGPALAQLQAVDAKLASLNTPMGPHESPLVVLGQAADEARAKLAPLQTQLDNFYAAHPSMQLSGSEESYLAKLQDEVTLQQKVTQEIQTQINAARERTDVGAGEKKNDSTEYANKAAEQAKKNAEIIRKAFEELDKTLLSGWEKYAHASAKTLEEQIEWEGKAEKAAEEVTEAHLRGDERVRESKAQLATASLKAAGSADRDAIKQQAELGLISKREERAQLAAIDQQELQDAITHHQAALGELQEHLHEMKAAQAADPSNVTAISNAAAAQAKLNDENIKFIALQAQLKSAIAANDAAAAKMASSWKLYFAQMKTETQDLSTQIRTTLEGSVTQFTRVFADSMARAIVENKSLGKAVRQEAGHMLESMISMLVQWLEKWILSHTLAAVVGTTTDKTAQMGAAQLAGANMVASWAAAPWPIDAMAPAMGATAFGAAMAFGGGGEVPGYGSGDSVPAMLTPGETVVTKALTDQVKSGGGGRGHTFNFSPVIHAVDSEGVERMLQKHEHIFAARMTSVLRKNHAR